IRCQYFQLAAFWFMQTENAPEQRRLSGTGFSCDGCQTDLLKTEVCFIYENFIVVTDRKIMSPHCLLCRLSSIGRIHFRLLNQRLNSVVAAECEFAVMKFRTEHFECIVKFRC